MIDDRDWYECRQCSYGTNSLTKVDAHEIETGHTMDLVEPVDPVDRPRLYPGHRHQWTDAGIADPLQQNRQIVRCTVCDFTVPRSLANLDGAMLNDAVYDEPDTDQGGAT